MPLLAYSVRRAVGALTVLLVVIGLIQFAVAHIGVRIFHPLERSGYDAYFWTSAQPALANEWDTAVLEVGLGLLVVVGFGAAWRLHKRRAT
jgi:hypothetical protein